MATRHRLTARMVAQMKVPGVYPDGASLYLQVTHGRDSAPRRSWLFRFTSIDGRRREMGLGSAALVDLAEARKKAHAASKLVTDGVDPIDARQSARRNAIEDRARAMTFRDCAEAYITAHTPTWKNAKHRWQWLRTLEMFAYPVFGDVDVRSVDVSLVMRVLDPIWQSKAETASRLRGRIESILDWATVRKHRTGENPARWRGHLQKALPARKKTTRVQHHAALPYAEIGDFLAALRAHPGVAARALEFTILTAARTGETIGAQWSEIDFDAATWTIPAARMKSGRTHRVALSKRASEILRALHAPRADGVVFSGARSGTGLSNMAMMMTLRRLGRGDLTVHGFRSTFRDWTAEQTDFAREVAEAALAHTLADKVEAAYRRGDLFEKRHKLMDAWARYCTTPLTVKKSLISGPSDRNAVHS